MQYVEPEFCNLMTVYISYSLAGCLVVCLRVVKGGLYLNWPYFVILAPLLLWLCTV